MELIYLGENNIFLYFLSWREEQIFTTETPFYIQKDGFHQKAYFLL